MNGEIQREEYAAHRLLGIELAGGWIVTEKMPRAPDATGGNFSVGYVVERNGQSAYLKALDYSFAFKQEDFARVVQDLTEAFNFERDILDECSISHMSRVVAALEHGQVVIEGAPGIPQVSYLIFERADGDVRKALGEDNAATDAEWRLRVLHHASVGLSQMHRGGMAHQDMKPSNLLIFNGDSAKVADLGRASKQNAVAPHDNFDFPGDPAYKPLEFFYNQISPNWNERRQASDLYMLGSLALFLFAEAHTTAFVIDRLPDAARPGVWTGTYAEALPYVRVAFNDLMENFTTLLHEQLDDYVADGIARIIRYLCEPDPARRGHPRTHAVKHGNPYSLERFVADFDSLSRRAGRIGR